MYFFSAKCRSTEYSLQDAGKYHCRVDVGTPAKKPPQRTTTWLQGAVEILMSSVTFCVNLGLLLLCFLSIVFCMADTRDTENWHHRAGIKSVVFFYHWIGINHYKIY